MTPEERAELFFVAQEWDVTDAPLCAEVIRAAIVEFYEQVNARAEADMLAGNPITGAHHRALEAQIVIVRTPEENALQAQS